MVGIAGVSADTMLEPTAVQEGLTNGMRLKYPSLNNPFFFSGKYNAFAETGKKIGPPKIYHNCTWYAYGRFGEILGERPKLPTGNAGTWYDKCKNYKKGKEPKLGAVMVWKYPGGGYGHVAVVEKIDKNGDVLTSGSGYNEGKNPMEHLFYKQTFKKSNNYNYSNWSFQGFIYQPKDVTFSGSSTYEGTNTVNKSNVITEADLEGMEGLLVDFGDGAGPVSLADSSSLTQQEKLSLEILKNDIQDNRSNKINIFFRFMSFLGFLLVLYSIFLGVAYLFDRSNTIIDIQLLRVMSLGKLRYWDEFYGTNPGYNKTEEVMYCDAMTIIKVISAITIIGLLLTNGVIFKMIVKLVAYIVEIITAIFSVF